MIDDARINQIYEDTSSYVIDLAKDPASLGPAYIQETMALCRNYLNKVSLIFTELSHVKMNVSAELRAAEAAFQLDYDDSLANDEHVKRLANIEDRKSTVAYMLRDQKKRVNTLKDQLHLIDAVYKVVNHRSRELHATMTEIKDQRRTMQNEMQSGAFYGDERVARPDKKAHSPARGALIIDEDEIGAILEEAAGTPAAEVIPDAVAAPQAPEAPPPPAPPPQEVPEPPAPVQEVASPPSTTPQDPLDEEAAMLRFLNGSSTAGHKQTNVTRTDEEDITALLDSV